MHAGHESFDIELARALASMENERSYPIKHSVNIFVSDLYASGKRRDGVTYNLLSKSVIGVSPSIQLGSYWYIGVSIGCG